MFEMDLKEDEKLRKGLELERYTIITMYLWDGNLCIACMEQDTVAFWH